MKYKVGDKVRIKSLDWYNENKVSEFGDIDCGAMPFMDYMTKFCNKIVTISNIDSEDECYEIEEDGTANGWTDEMIEGLAEEEKKPEFKVGDKITNGKTQLTILQITSDEYIVEDSFGECGTLYFNTQDDWKLVKEEIELIDNLLSRWADKYILPAGCQFKDENGNEVYARKIVLEKKKYPKTYEECKYILGITTPMARPDYNGDLIVALQKLLICRDAYWKIYGEENGLGKPWEYDCKSDYFAFAIIYRNGWIQKVGIQHKNAILAFPTEEMRNAFYENFKELIEQCKELL